MEILALIVVAMSRRLVLLVALATFLFPAGVADAAEYWYSEHLDGTGRLITCSTPEGAKDRATIESALASGSCRVGTIMEYGDFRERLGRQKALRSASPVYVPMPAPGPSTDLFGLFAPPGPTGDCYRTAWGSHCD